MAHQPEHDDAALDAATLPDLDDGVPTDDDAEAPDAGPGDHSAGTGLYDEEGPA